MGQERPATSLTRQELYDLVWSEPMIKVAATLGVSGVALAKTCGRHTIPVPTRGYWARIRTGKRVDRVPLHPRGLGMPDTVRMGGSRWWRQRIGDEPENLLEAEIPPSPQFSETVPELLERVHQLVGVVPVPNSLKNTHRSVAKLLSEDEDRRSRQLASSYSSSWDAPLFDSPRQRRRLRIVNAIFVKFSRLGMKPHTPSKEPEAFYVEIGEQTVSFSLDYTDDRKRGQRRGTAIRQVAGDKLRLSISGRRNLEGVRLDWEGTHEIPLERSIADIVVSLIVVGELSYRHQVIAHHRWLTETKARLLEEARKRMEDAVRKERARIAQVEQAKIERLLSEAEALRHAKTIRAYVEEVRQSLEMQSDADGKVEFGAWSLWALAQADRIDPVLSGRFLETWVEATFPSVSV